uniref:Protein kinase domain-containing protein n=1 Tax=Hyaloperonospora arabidopsidis (strain Emoy2) TaxID=559515 RepID=M4BV15_HYAAE
MSSSKTETSPKAAGNKNTILESVKTWTFAQLLASSFAKASLENEDEDPVAVPGERTLENDGRSEGVVESNDWDCSYSCLQPVASTRTTSSSMEGPHITDWDCPYNRPKPAASRPRMSASSSSSTLLLDAELGHSIDELLDHDETADERTEEEVTVCRDPTRHVFDIVRIIGSGTYGTVLLCRLQGGRRATYRAPTRMQGRSSGVIQKRRGVCCVATDVGAGLYGTPTLSSRCSILFLENIE